MSAPRVAIGIITYNRVATLLKVITSIQKYVSYPNLVWVLSDDGSRDDTLKEARKLGLFDVIISHNRLGMGGNWNRMIAACEEVADYTLCCQDDWLFTHPVNLQVATAFLAHNPRYGMIRYHKLTGHVGLRMLIKEWDSRAAFQNLRYNEMNEYAPHMLPYLDLIPAFGDSNTYSPFSGGVHLRHKRFTTCYGHYREGATFSGSEMDFMARVNLGLRHNPDIVARVAMFPDFIVSRFRDLGVSYRNTPVEMETLT